MNIEEVYDNLVKKGATITKGFVNIRTGLFKENDLATVHEGCDLYFKIDKESLIEFINVLIPKIKQLPVHDSYSNMRNVLHLVQYEINDYFGFENQDKRNSYYVLNGSCEEDEDTKICSMGQLKNAGIAKCVEKASVANNVLLMLKEMNLFDYEVNYVNSLLKFDDMTEPEGHAYIEFDRVNSAGNIIHIIFDVTNPEKIIRDDKIENALALYILKDDEYNDFINGGSFDSSKFVEASIYEQVERRTYFGFSKKEERIKIF